MSDEPSPPDPGGARQRRLLTVFLLVHWWAVLAYVLPSTREALAPVPDPLEVVAGKVIPKAVLLTLPVTEVYWNLTATRQTWTLFAPWPAAWSNSVRVVPYFPAGEGTWVADTVQVEGAAERPYPHLLRHRSYRILFNLGYTAWEGWYRPFFAREMCSTLRDQDGRRPEGVALQAVWTPIPVPWQEGQDTTPYPQRLGGYDCSALRIHDGSPWREYGLPEVLDTRGWPVVTSPADTIADAPADTPMVGSGS